jgi:hypothetical protein
MNIDWSFVKKTTLWQYEELIDKLLDIFNYDFILKYYNHSRPDAVTYSQKLQNSYILNGKIATFITEITEHFKLLDRYGIKDYLDLIQQINNKTNCVSFLNKSDIRFVPLIQLLNYIFRWILPFKCPIKEIAESIPSLDNSYSTKLREYNIRFNLDILETCRLIKARVKFSKEIELTEKFIIDLINRADISRLAYVRGKTIKHLCGGGYDSLEKIANADIKQMEKDMTAYYATLGKSLSDFKAAIPRDWMIGGAKVLPKIVER